jgi:rSAM/selenodomain-associated transferase 2
VKIAVVIPALDEAHSIKGAVESASAVGSDVVVVDGGSRDGTPERARAAGARVLAGERGRARQQRLGVQETQGEVVLLLHADSRLEPGWADAIGEALADPSVAGGAFRLRFDDPGRAFRLLEWGVRLRVALFKLPYGDQAIFVRRRVLEEVGGIPDTSFLEDLDLVKAIRSRGRLRALPLSVTTSSRRYRRQGLLRTVALHGLAALAWSLGVDRSRIERWVRG